MLQCVPPPEARRHSPNRAIGARAHRGQVLVSLGHLPDGLVQLLPVERGPLLRHLPAAAAGRGGGRAGGPCLQPHALLCARRSPALPAAGRTLPPQPPAQLRTLRPLASGPCQPRRLLRALATCGSRLCGLRLRPPRSPCSRCPGRPRTTPARATAPARAPVAEIFQATTGSLSRKSRENSSRRQRLASRDLTQYGTCPGGGGVREREAALARRETKLGRRGRNSRGLSTSRTRRRRQQRMPRAPLCGRLGECLAPWRKATDCDRVAGEKSQKIFELQATCSLEPAISKKPLQEQTGPVQKAVAFLSAQGHMTYSWGC